MARDQTVFSELSVAMAIAASPIEKIKNVDAASIVAFERERKKRALNQSDNSEEQLRLAGTKIRNWLIKEKGLRNISIAWTGMEKGKELLQVARDLVIEDQGTRISVKEDAQLFQNPSPARVFNKWPLGDFAPSRDGDWYIEVAEDALENYFISCDGPSFTRQRTAVDYYKNTKGKTAAGDKRRKAFTEHVKSLHDDKSTNVLDSYQELCKRISQRSAQIFNENISSTLQAAKAGDAIPEILEKLFSFFFKLDNQEHLLCGTDSKKSFAVVICGLGEWRTQFEIDSVVAKPIVAGQPEVLLDFSFRSRTSGESFNYGIKCEVRWSHGKFCGNPESKLYRSGNWSYSNLAWSKEI
jgi:hypothetical protein